MLWILEEGHGDATRAAEGGMAAPTASEAGLMRLSKLEVKVFLH